MTANKKTNNHLHPNASIKDNIAFQEAMTQYNGTLLPLDARDEKADSKETNEIFETAIDLSYNALIAVINSHVATTVAARIGPSAAPSQASPAAATGPADIPAPPEYRANFSVNKWLKKTLDESAFDDILTEFQNAAGLIHMQPDDNWEMAKPPHYEALLASFWFANEAVFSAVLAFGAKCFAEGQHPDYHMTRPAIN